jgi:NAD(P)H-nitrite reductase large subunit
MHVVIVGNGIAGITAARYIRKLSDHDITVISAESDHFYSRTALMYVYMGHMTFDDVKPYEDGFWTKNRITLMRAFAQSVETQKKTIRLSTGQVISYDKLILATGSKSNKMEWPGRNLRGVQGLYGLPDLALMEQFTHGITSAVVVGGGLLGLELCEMLRSRDIEVNLLVREAGCWQDALPVEESDMVNRHVAEHHVNLLTNTELKQILDDGQGRVRAVETVDGRIINCQFVGLAVGVHPNLDVARNAAPLEFKQGILVNRYLETNVPDVFAVGDCVQQKHRLPGRLRVEQVWYTGKIMGATVAKTICGHPTMYEPGNWYNSAKFFDIEYSVYGNVPNAPEPNQKSLFWQHAGGRKSIRIVFVSDQGNRVIGFNLMGVRMRHNVCDQWLTEGRDLEYVLQHLKAARFDPEMGDTYEKQLLKVFEKETGRRLKLQKIRKASILRS